MKYSKEYEIKKYKGLSGNSSMLRFSPYDKVKFLAISISFPFNVA